jgi:exoribonuclease II
VFRALGCEPLARGTRVRVRLTGLDLLTLEVHANLLSQLDAAAGAAADAGAEADGAEGEDELSEAPPALALAIDLSEAETPAAPPAVA